MRRSSILRAAVFVFVSVGIFFLPVYPCTVNEHEGGSFPPFERNSQYILPLPPFLVLSNGLHWKEVTPTADWGITWSYDGNLVFIPLLAAVIMAFGAWLWRLDAKAKAGSGALKDRQKEQRTVLFQAGAFFVLAGLFFFTANFIKGIYLGKNAHIKNWPSDWNSFGYASSNPPVYPSINIALALCVLAVMFGVLYLGRAYLMVAAAKDDSDRRW